MSEGNETPNLAEIESRCWVVAAHVASHRRDGSRCPNDLEMLNRATDDIADLLDQLSSLTTRLEAAERERDEWKKVVRKLIADYRTLAHYSEVTKESDGNHWFNRLMVWLFRDPEPLSAEQQAAEDYENQMSLHRFP